jgi:uracil-DNA glycosylase
MGLTLEEAAAAARACTLCTPHLPLGPRPVFRVSATARLLIIGQAPGTKVHATGIPWNDPSGERLRDWMGIDRDRFYDAGRIAIVPAGLCYPGRLPRGGDAPPRPECAPLWHPRLIPPMAQIRLTLLVGGYAIRGRLGPRVALEAQVAGHAALGPALMALPHPSWRTRAWADRRPWFAAEVLPLLRRRVAEVLDG